MTQDLPSSVMLFAAGFGTRMKSLTKNRPKPLIKVAGKPLIDYALELAYEIEPKHIVANLHYQAEQLRTHLAPKGVEFSLEAPSILDTGGGLRQALSKLGNDPVFTMNSDVIWTGPNPLKLALEAWDPKQMDALLVCVPLVRAVGRKGAGDFTADASGRISRGGDLVYGGVQIIKTSGLHQIQEKAFSLNVLWNQIHNVDRLFALEYPGHWCDVGYPEGIELAETLLKSPNV
ncbi:nucleotidyltransferase family protein [Parasedimentitalea huanghaiensis]|nr:nucleotidyltransferase family protein [Zongyanglinia huanghaiensis]